MMKTGNGQQGERGGMGSKSFTFGVSGVTPIFRWDPILGSSSATNRAEVARRSSKKQEALRFLPTLLGGVPLSNHVGRFNRLLLLFYYSDRQPKSLGRERRGEAPNNFLSSKNGTSVRPSVRPTRRGIRGGSVGYYVTADPVSGRRCRGGEDVSACGEDIPYMLSYQTTYKLSQIMRNYGKYSRLRATNLKDS